MFKVDSKYLNLIAFFVWFAAGINVLIIGITPLFDGSLTNYDLPTESLIVVGGSVATFFIFHPMFSNIIGKHSARIRSYGCTHQWFWKFFDKKSFAIMAFMMTLGICLRTFNLLPLIVLAPFYIGIGCALTLGGIGFLMHYIFRGKEIKCPVTGKTRLA